MRIKTTHAPMFKDRTRCGVTIWDTRSKMAMVVGDEEPTCGRCSAILAGEVRRLQREERENTDKIASSFGG